MSAPDTSAEAVEQVAKDLNRYAAPVVRALLAERDAATNAVVKADRDVFHALMQRDAALAKLAVAREALERAHAVMEGLSHDVDACGHLNDDMFEDNECAMIRTALKDTAP